MSGKGPDRLNYTKSARKVVEKIDDRNYMELSYPTTSRAELFLYAMALGLETLPIKLENMHPGGLVLDSSIDSKTRSLMYAYCISANKDTKGIDDISKDNVYVVAQEYANTGFQILEDCLINKKEEEFIWESIEELDELFKRI